MKLGCKVTVLGSLTSHLTDVKLNEIFDIERSPDVMTLGLSPVVASIRPALKEKERNFH